MFTVEKLSNRCWKVVEDDAYGQYPFLYVIQGVDKMIVIDTGCGGCKGGGENFRTFVTSTLNIHHLPYLIICTHIHFDHVGGNYLFSDAIDICMSSLAQKFTQNIELSSLGLSRGCHVHEFQITKWLKEGDRIYLDDNNPTEQLSLQVIMTPGHTPDSIALLAHWEKRLFIGDTVYPYTAIHVDCLGSNLKDYIISLKKLKTIIQNAQLISHPSPSSSSPSSYSPQQLEMMNNFMALLDVNNAMFSVSKLLETFSWQMEEAVNHAFENFNDLARMYPQLDNHSSNAENHSVNNENIHLSCGHVEANLEPSAIDEILNLVSFIKMNIISPISVDDGYGEYSNDKYTIILSLEQINSLPEDIFSS